MTASRANAFRQAVSLISVPLGVCAIGPRRRKSGLATINRY